MPSIDELSLLWQNRFNVNKALFTIAGAVVLPTSQTIYMSSNEIGDSDANAATGFDFLYGQVFPFDKNNSFALRAIRAF
jgi:hypothetical protein